VVSRWSVLSALACAVAMAAPANAASTAPAPARYVARVAAAQPVRFTLHVPLRNRAELETLIRAQSDPASPLYRRFLTPGQFRTRYGIAAATLARLRTVFGGFGLRVVDAGSQDVTLDGPAANVERALGTELWFVASDGAGWQAAARDPITLPAAVADSAVVGLDATIIRHTHSAEIRPSAADIANARLRGAVLPHNEFGPFGPYLTSDIKQAYRYPSLQSLSGRGAIVGILMDGASNATDVAAYFRAMDLPAPAVTLRTVTAAKTGPATSDPLETTLDIEQIGGIAPDATILDYDVRNLDDDSIYQGFKAIVEDDRAAIVDLPFGACEQYYNGRYTAYLGAEAVPKTLFAQDDLLAQGTAQGQSFVASSGDAGAVACLKPSGFLSYPNADLHPIPGVEYPASDPHVVAVGGTKLVTSYSAGSTASTYVGENAEEDHLVSGGIPSYFGSGGGRSQFFDLPAYQKEFGLHSPGRLVPDVAGHMGGCPSGGWVCGPDASSDFEVFNGTFIMVIGTSAAASDFTGLLALDAQAHAGRHGLVDTELYALAAKNGSGMTYFHSDVPGFNGYRAAPRYDEITGLGSVIGVSFIGSPLRPVAGNPGTASNPSATYTYLGSNAVDLTMAPAAPSAATASFDACGGNGCKMAASSNFYNRTLRPRRNRTESFPVRNARRSRSSSLFPGSLQGDVTLRFTNASVDEVSARTHTFA